jgi:hypothetical protein
MDQLVLHFWCYRTHVVQMANGSAGITFLVVSDRNCYSYDTVNMCNISFSVRAMYVH